MTTLEGTIWRINDSGNRFVVVSDPPGQYVIVENVEAPSRRRRILRRSLRSSKAKNGYTQIGSPL